MVWSTATCPSHSTNDFGSAFALPTYVNLLILLIVGAILTLYVAVVQPYKNTAIFLLHSTAFVNLNLLAGFAIVSSLSKQTKLQATAVGLSTGVAFVQFCGVVLYSVITVMKNRLKGASFCHCDNEQEERSTVFYGNLDRDPVEPAVHPLLNSSIQRSITKFVLNCLNV